MIVKFRIRRDTAANWTSVNPVLALGEPGLETDTRRIKHGDGTTAWNSLAYSKGAVAWGDITGTLSAQTDLQAALDAKQAAITPAALTKTDDTNVTLTLGGSPSTALFAAASLTLGWTGQLPVARGGTGVSTSTGSGAVVLATAPTFTTSITLGSTSNTNFLFNASSGSVAGRFQLDGAGNLVFRNETSGGLFFDAFNGTITFRNYGSGSATLFRIGTTDVRAGADNTINLGIASHRWKEVFAGNATINTSDERLKDWLGGLAEAEVRAGLRIADAIGLYRWLEGSRVHVGVRAQQVARILIEEGVETPQPMDFAADVFVAEPDRPSFRMAFLTFDTWEAEREPVMREVCVKRATQSAPAVRDSVQRIATPSYRPKVGEVVDADGLVWRERKAGNLFGIRTGELALFLSACEAAERRRMSALLDQLTT
ncbi:MAG: hypothetical protein EOP58_08675 [Sphingomonadales bacterium]|nr:MAG: hypothetical protein EOP58_08675 [Sphingomonadales bacterium]